MKKAVWSLILVLAAQPAWARPDGAQTVKPPGNPSTEKQANPKDVEAAAYIKQATAQFGKQSDAEAKASIEKLVAIWKDKDVTDTTTKPIPELLERYAKQDVLTIAVAAIEGLGQLDASAAAPSVLAVLQRTMKAKDPVQDLYAACFSALKKLADPKASTLATLEDYLDHRIDGVISRTADAIAGYANAPGDVRRDLFEALIKKFEGVFNASNSSKKNPAQAQKWAAVAGPVMSALNAVSGQSFRDPAQARQWFNDHKEAKFWQ
jgi:hypothetical protein